MSLHIFRANDQEAVRHRVHIGDLKPRWCTIPPYKRLWAFCCAERRLAKNLIIHVYYDGDYFFCKAGMGCKDPRTIQAARNREFKNRSVGNKLAWVRRKATRSTGDQRDPDSSGAARDEGSK